MKVLLLSLSVLVFSFSSVAVPTAVNTYGPGIENNLLCEETARSGSRELEALKVEMDKIPGARFCNGGWGLCGSGQWACNDNSVLNMGGLVATRCFPSLQACRLACR